MLVAKFDAAFSELMRGTRGLRGGQREKYADGEGRWITIGGGPGEKG